MFTLLYVMWLSIFLFELYYKRWERIERSEVSNKDRASSIKREAKHIGMVKATQTSSFSDIKVVGVGEEDIDDMDEEVGVDNIDFSPGLV